jgi:hypothetical protein
MVGLARSRYYRAEVRWSKAQGGLFQRCVSKINGAQAYGSLLLIAGALMSAGTKLYLVV